LLGLGCKCCPEFPEQIRNKSQPSPESTADRTLDGFHRFTFFIFPTQRLTMTGLSAGF
jgi:hypothetical protein